MKDINEFMSSEESKKMLALLGECAEKISKLPKVKKKAFEIFQKSGTEEAKSYVYMLAIGALCGPEELQLEVNYDTKTGNVCTD